MKIDALRDANSRQRAHINKLENEAAAQQDVGEFERKLARLAELENTTRRLEFENIALKSELKDLEDARKPASLIDTLNAALAALNKKVNAGSGRSKIDKAAVSALSALRQFVDLLPPPVTKDPELTPAAADDGREAARALPMTEVT